MALVGVTLPLVGAHVMPTFPTSFDGKSFESDYYAVQYLNPNGENGTYLRQGGYLRDRPPARYYGTGYAAANALLEVQEAIDLGIDLFHIDLFTWSNTGSHAQTEYFKALVNAANAEAFKVVPCFDMQGDSWKVSGTRSATKMLECVAYLFAQTCALKDDQGKLVVSAFDADNETAAWWKTNLIDAAAAQSTPVTFLPTTQADQTWQDSMDELGSLGGITWGGSLTSTGLTGSTVFPQYMRPNRTLIDEYRGAVRSREQVDSAIRAGNDILLFGTWNDYAESTHIRHSQNTGEAYSTLAKYHAARFKAGGDEPEVTEESIVYLHRVHSVLGTTWTKRNSPTDVMSVTAFLSEPARLTVEQASSSPVFDLPAGVSTITVPMENGTPRFVVERDGEELLDQYSDFRFGPVDPRVPNYLYHGRKLLL